MADYNQELVAVVDVSRDNMRPRHKVVFQNQGYHLGGPYNNDYSILGSMLGYPYLGKLPYI